MTTTNRIDERIVSGSMGSYLLPPKHPGYFYSIETDLRHKKENRGSMSLEYAIENDFTHQSIKRKVKKLIEDWHKSKPALESAECQEWIDQVNQHFGKGEKAVQYIQKYYPDYKGLTI